MKYAFLIYESAEGFAARTGPDAESYMGAWMAYSQALKDAGHHAGGSGLEPPAAGTTVRHRGDERAVQDGPYADTKEQLGGFFLVDMPDLDAALEWASRCPLGEGAIEVRPVMGNCQATGGPAAVRAALVS